MVKEKKREHEKKIDEENINNKVDRREKKPSVCADFMEDTVKISV